MIDKVLRSIEHVPAFPTTVIKVSEMLRDDDYSVAEVVNLIKHDPAIATNILKMSNSAYLSPRQKIGTVRDAVVYLGRNNLIRVIQTAGISRFFGKANKGYAVTATELWEHSVASALFSQMLSRKIMKREDEKLYLAALLHDVGKIVLGEFVHESFERILELVAGRGYSFLEAEDEVIGINHAELGGRMAARWNFPREIVDALSYHHRPDLLKKDDDETVWLVYLADQACLMMGIAGGADGLTHRGLSEVMTKFGFYQRDLEMGMMQLAEDLKCAKDLTGIV